MRWKLDIPECLFSCFLITLGDELMTPKFRPSFRFITLERSQSLAQNHVFIHIESNVQGARETIKLYPLSVFRSLQEWDFELRYH